MDTDSPSGMVGGRQQLLPTLQPASPPAHRNLKGEGGEAEDVNLLEGVEDRHIRVRLPEVLPPHHQVVCVIGAKNVVHCEPVLHPLQSFDQLHHLSIVVWMVVLQSVLRLALSQLNVLQDTDRPALPVAFAVLGVLCGRPPLLLLLSLSLSPLLHFIPVVAGPVVRRRLHYAVRLLHRQPLGAVHHTPILRVAALLRPLYHPRLQ
uniref:Putative serine/threonine-protein kinase pknJ n=1 Tax=Lygus hesperus TaxID=30085 RepID=A0A0A9XHC1_LYGHE